MLEGPTPVLYARGLDVLDRTSEDQHTSKLGGPIDPPTTLSLKISDFNENKKRILAHRRRKDAAAILAIQRVLSVSALIKPWHIVTEASIISMIFEYFYCLKGRLLKAVARSSDIRSYDVASNSKNRIMYKDTSDSSEVQILVKLLVPPVILCPTLRGLDKSKSPNPQP